MLDAEVRLPYDDVLLDWARKNDPDAARIILAVQAKAAATPTPRPRVTVTEPEADPEPRPSRRSLEYKQTQMRKRVLQPLPTATQTTPAY
jgi:hypothetical protein